MGGDDVVAGGNRLGFPRTNGGNAGAIGDTRAGGSGGEVEARARRCNRIGQIVIVSAVHPNRRSGHCTVRSHRRTATDCRRQPGIGRIVGGVKRAQGRTNIVLRAARDIIGRAGHRAIRRHRSPATQRRGKPRADIGRLGIKRGCRVEQLAAADGIGRGRAHRTVSNACDLAIGGAARNADHAIGIHIVGLGDTGKGGACPSGIGGARLRSGTERNAVIACRNCAATQRDAVSASRIGIDAERRGIIARRLRIGANRRSIGAGGVRSCKCGVEAGIFAVRRECRQGRAYIIIGRAIDDIAWSCKLARRRVIARAAAKIGRNRGQCGIELAAINGIGRCGRG